MLPGCVQLNTCFRLSMPIDVHDIQSTPVLSAVPGSKQCTPQVVACGASHLKLLKVVQALNACDLIAVKIQTLQFGAAFQACDLLDLVFCQP